MSSKTVIITAGGIGKRMNSTIPKQFLLLNELPVLMHSISAFYNYDPTIQIIVTIPSFWSEYWQDLCAKFHFNIKHEMTDGGLERYDSIKNALKLAKGKIIAIHDGVRPIVSRTVINESFVLAEKEGASLPIVSLKDSLRYVDKDETLALNRKKYFLVQTPQTFESSIIRKAYELPYHDGITDDASLVEEAGFHLALFEGEEFNIKITTPLDLKLASLYLNELRVKADE